MMKALAHLAQKQTRAPADVSSTGILRNGQRLGRKRVHSSTCAHYVTVWNEFAAQLARRLHSRRLAHLQQRDIRVDDGVREPLAISARGPGAPHAISIFWSSCVIAVVWLCLSLTMPWYLLRCACVSRPACQIKSAILRVTVR